MFNSNDRVIFLDVDGVLNSYRYRETVHNRPTIYDFMVNNLTHEQSLNELDPEPMALLSELVKETRASVVFSSSWRLIHTLKELEDLFAERCSDFPRWAIKGVTPEIMGDSLRTGHRGSEIKLWMKENNYDSDHYVIFDDVYDMLPEQLNNFVPTNPELGLTEGHIDIARSLLMEGVHVTSDKEPTAVGV